MTLQTVLTDFFADPRTRAIFGLIVLDVVLGVSSALKLGQFKWTVLANFYRTNVMPYVLGYFVAWLFVRFGLTDVLGQLGGETSATIFSAPVCIALVASIGKSLQTLGILPNRTP
jgi:hypothetical protein